MSARYMGSHIDVCQLWNLSNQSGEQWWWRGFCNLEPTTAFLVLLPWEWNMQGFMDFIDIRGGYS